MNLTAVHDHAVVAGRAGQRHFEDLVFYVLTRVGIVQSEQSVEECQVGTDFV